MENPRIRTTLYQIPNNQNTMDRLIVPFALQVQPFYENDSVSNFEQLNIQCKCGSYITTINNISFENSYFICEVCGTQNIVREQQISQLSQIQEDMNSYEILDPFQSDTPNTFIFIIDTSLEQSSFLSLIDSIKNQMDKIDFNNSRVGFVSFNKFVEIHLNLMNGLIVQKLILDTQQTELQRLQLLSQIKQGKNSNFLIDKKEIAFSILESIRISVNKNPIKNRYFRATGFALQTLLQIIQILHIEFSQIFLMIGGPCTYGQGKIAQIELNHYIRKQDDLIDNKDAKQLSMEAYKFYSDLQQNFLALNCTINLFAYSLDSFGLYEMWEIFLKQSSILIINEEFKQSHFQESLNKVFSNQHNYFNSNGRIKIVTNPLIKICGAIGSMTSLKKNIQFQGSQKIGEFDTNEWFVGSISKDSTYSIFLEIPQEKIVTQDFIVFQFQIFYRDFYGENKIWILNQKLRISPSKNTLSYQPYLDQYSIISLYSKIVSLWSLTQDTVSIRNYLDNKLITILWTFSNQGEIPENLVYLSQYFYYLRKSSFVNKMNQSLDEMIYFRAHLLQETVESTLIMIQPQILKYTLDEDPTTVEANLDCLQKDAILLVDTFFVVLVWKGKNIFEWEKQGYHLQMEYSHLRMLLEQPYEDRQIILENKLYHPELLEATEGSPFERILKSKLNPEKSINTQDDDQENYFTEDVTMSVFIEKLISYIK